MTPLPPVSGLLKVEMRFGDLHDENIINRFFMLQTTAGSPSASDLNTYAHGIRTAWFAGAIPNYVVATQQLIETTVQDLSSPIGAVGSYAGSGDFGGASGASMGAQVCFLVSFTIARRYRGGHPRLYMSGCTTTDALDAETVKPATVAALETAWTTFFTSVAALPVHGTIFAKHVNTSYYEGFVNFTYPSGRTYPRPTYRTTPLTDDVTGYIVAPKFATQRRRSLR